MYFSKEEEKKTKKEGREVETSKFRKEGKKGRGNDTFVFSRNFSRNQWRSGVDFGRQREIELIPN